MSLPHLVASFFHCSEGRLPWLPSRPIQLRRTLPTPSAGHRPRRHASSMLAPTHFRERRRAVPTRARHRVSHIGAHTPVGHLVDGIQMPQIRVECEVGWVRDLGDLEQCQYACADARPRHYASQRATIGAVSIRGQLLSTIARVHPEHIPAVTFRYFGSSRTVRLAQ
jgi:hypothetical protein